MEERKQQESIKDKKPVLIKRKLPAAPPPTKTYKGLPLGRHTAHEMKMV